MVIRYSCLVDGTDKVSLETSAANQRKHAMEIQSSTEKAQRLARTIVKDLEGLVSATIGTETEKAYSSLALALQENIDKVTSFSDLHDYMDANTLGESEEVWEALTDGIGPEGDERKVQAACDVLNEAQGIVDEWIKQGGLKAKSGAA
jgi:hypothetical protein